MAWTVLLCAMVESIETVQFCKTLSLLPPVSYE